MDKCVAIFGRSDASEKDPCYIEAFKCSQVLSKAGFSVITGGYEGIMKAASEGAFQRKSIGVPCSLFRSRKPNPYLSEVIWAKDLFERQKLLVDNSDAFVAFDPKAGTLSEVSLIFSLRKSGNKSNSPLCLVGKQWKKISEFFEKEGIISKNLLKCTFLCNGGKEAAQIIIDFFGGKEVSSGKRKR